MDAGERDPVTDQLGGDDVGPRVERGLRRDVRREAGRVGLHADRADVHDVAALLLAHRRDQPHDQPDRAEVVELHGALEVVEPVLRQLERAPDRPAGVVDHEVDRWQLGGQLLAEGVDGLEVGEVARVHVRRTAATLDGGSGLLELVLAARDQHRDTAALGHLQSGDLADAGGGAGDDDVLAGERLAVALVAAGGFVEVLLPVAPQRPGVRLEVRHRDARAGQRLLGAPGVEDRDERRVREHLGRDPQAADGEVEHRLRRGGLDHPVDQRQGPQGTGEQGQRPAGGDPAVDRGRERRRTRGLAEGVDHARPPAAVPG